MSISAAMVKELRDRTNSGMMDCKKALIECDGDMAKSADWLRQKGLVVAARRGNRQASAGQVVSYIHAGGKLGVLVEINCETDFTGKTEEFSQFAKDVAMQVAAADPISPDDLLKQAFVKDPGKTIEDLLNEMRAKTGENVQIRRFVRYVLGAQS